MRMRRIEAPARMRSEEVLAGAIEDVVVRHAAHADLIIMERPSDSFSREGLEAVLFKSGRPVLLAPPDWRGDAIGRRILVTWSQSREATRAVADAAAFLEEAEAVTIVSVETNARLNVPQPLGSEIAAHLIRRGVATHARLIESHSRREEAAFVDEASATGADLIVMGASSRSQLRRLLKADSRGAAGAPIPLFLSR